MNLDLADAQRILACIGDPSRFRVVALLADGDLCVTDIAHEVGLSQSCTTRHLQVLLKHAIVSRVRRGKRVLFRLRDEEPEMSRLLEWALLRSRHETPVPRPRPSQRATPQPDSAGAHRHRDRSAARDAVYQAQEAEDSGLEAPGPDGLAASPSSRAPHPLPDLEDYLL